MNAYARYSRGRAAGNQLGWRQFARTASIGGMKRFRAALAAVPVLAWLLLAPGNATAQGKKAAIKAEPASAGNVESGKKSFASHSCSGCHGSEGQGATGPQIAPPPLPLSDFARYVRQPVGLMPAFDSNTVPDSDLADVYAFLKSVAPPQAAAEVTPSGNAENGKRLFTRDGCYECHGFDGQGAQQTAAPTIGPPPLPFSAFANYIHHPAGSMPPYTTKVLSDAELADIYAYLKSIPPPPSPKNIPLLNQ